MKGFLIALFSVCLMAGCASTEPEKRPFFSEQTGLLDVPASDEIQQKVVQTHLPVTLFYPMTNLTKIRTYRNAKNGDLLLTNFAVPKADEAQFNQLVDELIQSSPRLHYDDSRTTDVGLYFMLSVDQSDPKVWTLELLLGAAEWREVEARVSEDRNPTLVYARATSWFSVTRQSFQVEQIALNGEPNVKALMVAFESMLQYAMKNVLVTRQAEMFQSQ
ncbi:hypothetical protein VST7929_03245 [Vibrio stylophorae]|uniref:ABC-type transport auxiliary lipoprotein component domain-containing protein n=1 Tax=Vibrio stylophorae TaxID=659351 RepID=A0ABM8ZY41_9VIBR|nr:hypothetical protein [Vibrio stylophorae]CAH0535771.1 hypothetical protein VST7929_03245 [Vibrio stylophorae]